MLSLIFLFLSLCSAVVVFEGQEYGGERICALLQDRLKAKAADLSRLEASDMEYIPRVFFYLATSEQLEMVKKCGVGRLSVESLFHYNSRVLGDEMHASEMKSKSFLAYRSSVPPPTVAPSRPTANVVSNHVVCYNTVPVRHVPPPVPVVSPVTNGDSRTTASFGVIPNFFTPRGLQPLNWSSTQPLNQIPMQQPVRLSSTSSWSMASAFVSSPPTNSVQPLVQRPVAAQTPKDVIVVEGEVDYVKDYVWAPSIRKAMEDLLALNEEIPCRYWRSWGYQTIPFLQQDPPRISLVFRGILNAKDEPKGSIIPILIRQYHILRGIAKFKSDRVNSENMKLITEWAMITIIFHEENLPKGPRRSLIQMLMAIDSDFAKLRGRSYKNFEESLETMRKLRDEHRVVWEALLPIAEERFRADPEMEQLPALENWSRIRRGEEPLRRMPRRRVAKKKSVQEESAPIIITAVALPEPVPRPTLIVADIVEACSPHDFDEDGNIIEEMVEASPPTSPRADAVANNAISDPSVETLEYPIEEQPKQPQEPWSETEEEEEQEEIPDLDSCMTRIEVLLQSQPLPVEELMRAFEEVQRSARTTLPHGNLLATSLQEWFQRVRHQ